MKFILELVLTSTWYLYSYLMFEYLTQL